MKFQTEANANQNHLLLVNTFAKDATKTTMNVKQNQHTTTMKPRLIEKVRQGEWMIGGRREGEWQWIEVEPQEGGKCA